MKKKMTTKRLWLGGPVVLLAAAALAGCGGSSGGSSSAFVEPSTSQCGDLKGNDITLTVPFSPGGGYDSYARLIAPELGKKIGSTVVVENEDGAGGLLAMNNLLRAKKDGTEILIMNGIGAGGASLAGADGVNFKLDDFSYVGRIAGDAQMIVGKGDGPYQTWADVEAAKGFRFGSTGPGASDFVTPSLLIAMFGLDAKVVSGFDGSSEVELSLLQGNVDGMSGQLDSRAAALANGDQHALLTVDRERPSIAPDTPTLLELPLDASQKSLAEAHLKLLDLGRPLIGPPGMDGKALACLRGALEETLKDPALMAKSAEAGRPFNYLSGQELQKTAAGLMKAPADYLKVLKDSFSTAAG